jgi:hypothetical protein
MTPDIPDGAIHEGEPPIVPNRWLAETTTRTQACCYLSTPEHVRSFVGTFIWIYTDKGELSLAEDYLRFTTQHQTSVEIALSAITDISIGHYSRIAKPIRLDYMAVTYQKNGVERTLLFTPTRSWVTPVWETNKIVNEWVEALHQARMIHSEQGAPTDSVSDLHGLNERWNQAWLEKDAATVERLMAEDYTYVAPNGLVLDRPAILTIIRSPNYRLDHATRTEVLIRPLGREAAVVRHRSQAAGSYEGASFTDDHRCVMICQKQAGEWRIVMEQHSFNRK